MDITCATCVESGQLEDMVLRWAESLRRFGGRLADAPIIVVTPRLGPPLARRTQERFREMRVEHVVSGRRRRFGWYHFLNKPVTLAVAEAVAGTDVIAWFDADTLVLGEPEALLLEPNVAFAACAPEYDIVGSTGPGDRFEPAWAAVCEAAGVSLDDLPYLTTHVEDRRIRLYWQGGVLVFRRTSGFAAEYLRTTLDLLEARIVLPQGGAHWLEQMAIGLAVVRLGCRWAELPWSHNFCVASFFKEQFERSEFSSARVLHYHDAMHPDHWDLFLGRLYAHHLRVASWLMTAGPLEDRASRLCRTGTELLRVARGVPRRLHAVRSRLVVAD